MNRTARENYFSRFLATIVNDRTDEICPSKLFAVGVGSRSVLGAINANRRVRQRVHDSEYAIRSNHRQIQPIAKVRTALHDEITRIQVQLKLPLASRQQGQCI